MFLPQNTDNPRRGPVSIPIAPSATGTDTSFQANVEVYRTNSRSVEGTKLSQKYRLSTKRIGNRIVTRLDFSPLSPGNRALSVITDGVTLVEFNTSTLEVYQRRTLPIGLSTGATQSTERRVMPGALDVTALRRQSARLGFDLKEDAALHALTVSCRIDGGAGLGELRTDIVVDTDTELVRYQKAGFTNGDGASVDTEQNYIYEVKEDKGPRKNNFT
jgi:hypothetical protein